MSDTTTAPMLRGRWDIAIGGLLGLMWFGVALHHVWSQPIDHDARGYFLLAGVIAHDHVQPDALSTLDLLFSIRLMGYPLFLTPFAALNLQGLTLRLSVAVVQLLAFWGAVLALRSGIIRLVNDRVARRVTFAVLASPFPYFVVVELITESLLLSLALLTFGAGMRAVAAGHSSRRWFWAVIAASSAGASMAVRTDAVFVVAMCVIGLAMVFRSDQTFTEPVRRWLSNGRCLLASGALVLACAALFRIPQYLVLHARTPHGNWNTPTNLTKPEFQFGVVVLKWATGIRSISGGFAYHNPFLTSQMVADYGADPLRWYRQQPLRGLGLIATKYFALLDQDVPFVYNDSMPSRPNPAVFVVNHVIVVLGVIGLVHVVRVCARRSTATRLRVAGCAFFAGAIIWLGTHALPHVEARYGLPALVALSACAGCWASAERLRAHRWKIVVALAVYMPLAWALSTWLITFRKVWA